MNNIKDERIIMEKWKIESNAYKLVLSILVTTVLIQQFFLNSDLKEYAGELIAIILATAYQAYCHVKKGIGTGEKENLKEILTSSVFVSLGGATFLFFIGGMTKPKEIIINVAIIFILNFVVRYVIDFFTKKKQTEIDKLIDED